MIPNYLGPGQNLDPKSHTILPPYDLTNLANPANLANLTTLATSRHARKLKFGTDTP